MRIQPASQPNPYLMASIEVGKARTCLDRARIYLDGTHDGETVAKCKQEGDRLGELADWMRRVSDGWSL